MNIKYSPVNIRHYFKYKLGIDSAYTQTSEPERACLLKHATGKHVIAEIGTFEAVNTRAFRSVVAEDGVVIAIDPYPRSLFGVFGFGWIRRIAHEEVSKVSRAQVLWVENLGKFAPTEERVKPYLPVDFLFIDGDHSYEGIKEDWLAWSDCVKPDGIVALHDSLNSNQCGSEIFTEETILKDNRFSFVESIDTLTIVRKN
jgi:predicted O-methyltransferase YrrM